MRSEAFPRIFHNPSARLTHSPPAVSQELPALGSLVLCPPHEGQRQARSCCCTPSLRCRSRLNSVPLWRRVFFFFGRRQAGQLHSVSSERVLREARGYMWPSGWDTIAASNIKTSPVWFCQHVTVLLSWLDPDWLTKVSA